MALRISIIEDDLGILNTLEQLINGWPEFTCASKHRKAGEALEQVPKIKPDVVLVDLELKNGETGVDCLRGLSRALPGTPLLVYSHHEHAEWVFPALTAGACGYIVKGCPASTLIDSIVAAHRGEAPMSSQIARQVIQHFQKKSQGLQDLEALTDQESRVLRMAARGKQAKEIADELKISVRTVETHFRKIYEKLHVHSRSQAVAIFTSTQVEP